jgi:hypothetical protein
MTPRMSVTSRLAWRASMPHVLLRVEGFAVLLVAVMLYADYSYNWWIFALLLLAPDLSMLGYALGNQWGSVVYNLVHTYTLPLLLAIISLVIGLPFGVQLALIWLAHIGMDRTVGYGLKYPARFKDSHLARV